MQRQRRQRSPQRSPPRSGGRRASAQKDGRRRSSRGSRRRGEAPYTEPQWASSTLRAASDWLSATGEQALALLENAAQGEQALSALPAARATRSSLGGAVEPARRNRRPLPPGRPPAPAPAPAPVPEPEPEPETESKERREAESPSPEAVLAKLEVFKSMAERGLISAADYSEQKRIILRGVAPRRRRWPSPGRSPQYKPESIEAASPRTVNAQAEVQPLLYYVDGEHPDPVESTPAELRELYQRGHISEEDCEVYIEGWSDWELLRERLVETGVLTEQELTQREEEQLVEAQRQHAADAEAARLRAHATRRALEDEAAAEAAKEKAALQAQRETERAERQAQEAARVARLEAEEEAARREEDERARREAEWWWAGDGEWLWVDRKSDQGPTEYRFKLATREYDGTVEVFMKESMDDPWSLEGTGTYQDDGSLRATIFGESTVAHLSADGERLSWSDGDEWARASRRTAQRKRIADDEMKKVEVKVLGWEKVPKQTLAREHAVYVLEVTGNGQTKQIKRRWSELAKFDKVLQQRTKGKCPVGDEWRRGALQTGYQNIGFDETKLRVRVEQLRSFFADFSGWATWLRNKESEAVDFFSSSGHGGWEAEIGSFLTRDSYDAMSVSVYSPGSDSPNEDGTPGSPMSDPVPEEPSMGSPSPSPNKVVQITVTRFDTVPGTESDPKPYTRYWLKVRARGVTSAEIPKRWSEVRAFNTVLLDFSSKQPSAWAKWTHSLPGKLGSGADHRSKLQRQAQLQEYFAMLARWATDFPVDLFDPQAPDYYRNLLQQFFEGFAPNDDEALYEFDDGGPEFEVKRPIVVTVQEVVETDSIEAMEAGAALYGIEFDSGDGRSWTAHKRWSEMKSFDAELVTGSVRLAAPAKWKAAFPTTFGSDRRGGKFDDSTLKKRREQLAEYWKGWASWATQLRDHFNQDVFNAELFPEVAPFVRDMAASSPAARLREMNSAARASRSQSRSPARSRSPAAANRVPLNAAATVEAVETDATKARYVIRVRASKGREWRCRKSWSEVKELFTQLRKISNIESSIRWTAKLPDKSTKCTTWSGNWDKKRLENRRLELQEYWSEFAIWANRLDKEYGEDVFTAGSNKPNFADFHEVQAFLRGSETRVPELQPEPEPEPEPAPEPARERDSSLVSTVEPVSRDRQQSSERPGVPHESTPANRSVGEPSDWALQPKSRPKAEPEPEPEPELQLLRSGSPRNSSPQLTLSPVDRLQQRPSVKDASAAGGIVEQLTPPDSERGARSFSAAQATATQSDAVTRGAPVLAPATASVQQQRRRAPPVAPPPYLTGSTHSVVDDDAASAGASQEARSVVLPEEEQQTKSSSIYTHMKTDLVDLKTMLEDGVLTQQEFDIVKRERLHLGLTSEWNSTPAEKQERWGKELRLEAGAYGGDNVRSKWKDQTNHASYLLDRGPRRSTRSASSSPSPSPSPSTSTSSSRDATPEGRLEGRTNPVRYQDRRPRRSTRSASLDSGSDSEPQSEGRSQGETLSISGTEPRRSSPEQRHRLRAPLSAPAPVAPRQQHRSPSPSRMSHDTSPRSTESQAADHPVRAFSPDAREQLPPGYIRRVRSPEMSSVAQRQEQQRYRSPESSSRLLRSARANFPSATSRNGQLEEDPRFRSPERLWVRSPTSGEFVVAPTTYVPDPDAEYRAQLKADDYHRRVERYARMATKGLAERSERKALERDTFPVHAHGSPDRLPTDKFGFVDRRYATSPVHGRAESPAHRHADRGVGVAPDRLFQARARSPGVSRSHSDHQPSAYPTRRMEHTSPQAEPDRMIFSSSAQREVPATFYERRGDYSHYLYRVNGQQRIKRIREEDGSHSYQPERSDLSAKN